MTAKRFHALLAGCLLSGAIAIHGGTATLAQTSTPATPALATTTLTNRERVEALWQAHQISVIFAGLLLGGYVGVLWLWPLLLLKLPAQDIEVPWTTWKLPLGLVRWLQYRDRVLDTWVNQHWSVAQTAFFQLDNVKARQIHIPLPVQLDQAKISDLQGADLTPTFQKKTAVC